MKGHELRKNVKVIYVSPQVQYTDLKGIEYHPPLGWKDTMAEPEGDGNFQLKNWWIGMRRGREILFEYYTVEENIDIESLKEDALSNISVFQAHVLGIFSSLSEAEKRMLEDYPDGSGREEYEVDEEDDN